MITCNEKATNIIYGTEGDDSLYDNSDYSTVIGYGGNDTVQNYGENVLIDVGSGNDSVDNDKGYYATINGGDGDDYISNYYTYYSSISGGSGDDLVSIRSAVSRNVISYTEGDGNDLIKGFNSLSTLQIFASDYSTVKSGSDIIVTVVGDGKITLEGVASLEAINIAGKEVTVNPLLITLTEGNDSYSNTVNSATILALSGNDTLSNNAKSVSILGGDGDDLFRNYGSGSHTTISTGAGNDKVSNYGDSVTIETGEGNDYIYNAGANVSISGGEGDDYIDNVDLSSNRRRRG